MSVPFSAICSRKAFVNLFEGFVATLSITGGTDRLREHRRSAQVQGRLGAPGLCSCGPKITTCLLSSSPSCVRRGRSWRLVMLNVTGSLEGTPPTKTVSENTSAAGRLHGQPHFDGHLMGLWHRVAQREQFRVLVTRRPKNACRACEEVVVQAPPPARLIEGGIPTEATVAQVLVSKKSRSLAALQAGAKSIVARGSISTARPLPTRRAEPPGICAPFTRGWSSISRSRPNSSPRDDRSGARRGSGKDEDRAALLGSSNRTAFCKRFFQRSVRPALWSVLECERCGRQVYDFAASSERLPEAGSSSRSTHGRRMMGLRRSSVPMWTTQFAGYLRVHPNKRNHRVPTSRQGQRRIRTLFPKVAPLPLGMTKPNVFIKPRI